MIMLERMPYIMLRLRVEWVFPPKYNEKLFFAQISRDIQLSFCDLGEYLDGLQFYNLEKKYLNIL